MTTRPFSEQAGVVRTGSEARVGKEEAAPDSRREKVESTAGLEMVVRSFAREEYRLDDKVLAVQRPSIGVDKSCPVAVKVPRDMRGNQAGLAVDFTAMPVARLQFQIPAKGGGARAQGVVVTRPQQGAMQFRVTIDAGAVDSNTATGLEAAPRGRRHHQAPTDMRMIQVNRTVNHVCQVRCVIADTGKM